MVLQCGGSNLITFLSYSSRYDFVEIEDPTEKTILGRWCGSQSAPAAHTSKGSQIRIRFISDEYFPSEPGFCIRYSLLPVVCTRQELKLCNVISSTLCCLFISLHPSYTSGISHDIRRNVSPCGHN